MVAAKDNQRDRAERHNSEKQKVEYQGRHMECCFRLVETRQLFMKAYGCVLSGELARNGHGIERATQRNSEFHSLPGGTQPYPSRF